MPIEDHPCFIPPDPTVSLWHYMDVAKFLSLVLKGGLWFSNGELLSRDDPHELIIDPSKTLHRTWITLDDVPLELREEFTQSGLMVGASAVDRLQSLKRSCDNLLTSLQKRRDYHISSWHQSPSESVAMWKIYGAQNAGIAIRTTPEGMRTAFATSEVPFYMGKVRYLGPSDPLVSVTNNIFTPVTYKRQAFEYEREVRMVVWDLPHIRSFPGIHVSKSIEPELRTSNGLSAIVGLTIECDINSLIEEIVVSPYAPDWYVDMLSELLAAHSISAQVSYSTLLKAPAMAAI